MLWCCCVCPPGQLTAFEDVNKNFKVVIRVRPPLPRELSGDSGPFENVVRVDPTERQITFSENLSAAEEDGGASAPFATHTFTFDHVYDQNCDQRKVYETTAKAVVDSSLQGYNATIFAYGQTVRQSHRELSVLSVWHVLFFAGACHCLALSRVLLVSCWLFAAPPGVGSQL